MLRTVLLLSFAATHAAAQSFVQTAQAVRITGASPRLDGRLEEDIWRAIPPATGFLQRDPDQGAPATQRTEVRFAYDEEALWIGARMHSTSPREIRALVTRHDREGTSEQLIVSLDTHHDRRTAYTFAVTPASVRIDYYHSSDNEDDQDFGFDPVWEAESRIDSLGWTAEMRIPFSQLRFSAAEVQTWGVNILRSVPARNEESYWSLIRRDEPGWASRMGTLEGVRGIRPSRRIEILPYVAVDSRLKSRVDLDDPFARRHEIDARLGADLKMGLGPSFTLDVTLNPDFGQVEADPAEVNLTAFETFFEERRPFFSEGAELLEGRGLFYSRRIGALPPGDPDADYAERLEHTSIL
ncbi:MAG: carbohydrate binding family 9 domain-containing protein, partial [Gemmatimonadota bacterium]|nr:carbohydrate binding family 9 domain-containing protein [Gemmatimonadota bacterium]